MRLTCCRGDCRSLGPPTEEEYMAAWLSQDVDFDCFLNLDVPSDAVAIRPSGSHITKSEGLTVSYKFIKEQLIPYCHEAGVRH